MEHCLVVDFDVSETDRLLTTTRSVRRRLDRTRPVPVDLIAQCIEVAMQAPMSSTGQGPHWIVVTDAAQRAAIGDVYRRASLAFSRRQAGGTDGLTRDQRSQQVLTDHLGEVPALVVVCHERRRWHDSSPHRELVAATVYGSVYPAVWAFQLACRTRGLATCFVAGHLRYPGEVADIVGLPDTVGQAGLVAVAYPTGGAFRPAHRPPLPQVLHHQRWRAGGHADQAVRRSRW